MTDTIIAGSIEKPITINNAPVILNITFQLKSICVFHPYLKKLAFVVLNNFSSSVISDRRQSTITRSPLMISVSPFGIISSTPRWMAAIIDPSGSFKFLRGMPISFILESATSSIISACPWISCEDNILLEP